MWVQVFPCGCEFSNLHFPDKMKSCRHKRHRHLILNWFRTGGGDLVGRRRGILRQGETDRQKSLWLENAARHRNRDVSTDEVHPPRARNIPQILLRRIFQRAGHTQIKACFKLHPTGDKSVSKTSKGHFGTSSTRSRVGSAGPRPKSAQTRSPCRTSGPKRGSGSLSVASAARCFGWPDCGSSQTSTG